MRCSNRIAVVGLFALFLGTARAADIHVLLDTDGDGTLNACLNPAHAPATPGANLFYCVGGSNAGKLVGTAKWAVAACTGGTLTAVTNGVSVDIDGDGTNEKVYAQPQAAVYNMAPSDTVEVHAGTYYKPGYLCGWDCGPGTGGVCDGGDCFQGIVAALGIGPNLTSNGYGTAAKPGRIRGALMRGARDSWDPNGDKNPSDSVYPAIFSGDANADGTLLPTTCTAGSCSNDSFSGIAVGCGSSTFHYCVGTTGLKLDTNADGTVDTLMTAGVKNTDYLVISDIEFKSFNQGGANNGSGRNGKTDGIIALDGNGASTGLVVDHVYMHGNMYTAVPSSENWWSYIADETNSGCAGSTEIKNSFLEQNNEKVIDSDCGLGNECGCALNVHDNKVVVNVTGGGGGRPVVFAYLKSIDTLQSGARKKVDRFWNNEFIYRQTANGSSNAWFMDLDAFGCSMHAVCVGGDTPGASCTSDGGCPNGGCSGCTAPPLGGGELWVYGNLFRYDPAASLRLQQFWGGFCGIGTGYFKHYLFNNTFDFGNAGSVQKTAMGTVCNDSLAGSVIAENNNAFYKVTGVHGTPTGSPTFRRTATSEICTDAATSCTVPSSIVRTGWFYPGLFTGVTYYNGIDNYNRLGGGPLDHTGTCDPDGDGTTGVDYDGDGTNDTVWADVAGNVTNCGGGDLMSIGARNSPCNVPDVTAPSVPSITSETQPSCGEIYTVWSPSIDIGGSGLAGYNLYDANALIYTTTDTSRDQVGLGTLSVHQYSVNAFDAAGNVSAKSNQLVANARACQGTGAQTINSSILFGSPTAAEQVWGVVVDSAGATYVSGSFGGTTTFGPGVSRTAAATRDAFVAKYDASNALVWVNAFGGVGDDYAFGLTLAGSNVIVVGRYQGTIDMDPSGATHNITTSGVGFFRAAYSQSAGAYQWALSTGNTGANNAQAVVADAAGTNFYVTGYFLGSVDFGDGSVTNTNTYHQMFLAKYLASDGSLVWVHRYGRLVAQVPVTTGTGNGLAIAANGNVLLAGAGGGPIDFGCGAVTPHQGLDAVAAAIDPSGTCVWSKSWGGDTETTTDDQQAFSITGTASGDVVVVGQVKGSINFGTGNHVVGANSSYGAFLVRVNGTTGVSLGAAWEKVPPIESNIYAALDSVVEDAGGDIWAAGALGGQPMDFGGGPTPAGSGVGTNFIVRYAPSGAFKWDEVLLTDATGGTGETRSIAFDVSGKLHTAGRISGTVNFGSGALVVTGTQDDAFIAIYTP